MHEHSIQNSGKNSIHKALIDRYDRIRQKKMYRQHNNQDRSIDGKALYDFLNKLYFVKKLTLRLHYQILGWNSYDDIPIISLSKFESLNNAPVFFSIGKIKHNDDDSLVIYQLEAYDDQAEALGKQFPFF